MYLDYFPYPNSQNLHSFKNGLCVTWLFSLKPKNLSQENRDLK